MNTTNNNTTVKAINRFATVRNYVIGFYIVEYEQHGSDRAKYGDRLLKRLAEKVNKRGINETLLKNCRNFYLVYPQIKFYLDGKSPTALDESSPISPTTSEELALKSSTLSNKFGGICVQSTPVCSNFSKKFWELYRS